MKKIRNILAAVGQFPQDDAVLTRASEIATAQHAMLTIVHVVDNVEEFDLRPADVSLIQHEMQLIAQENLEEAVARVGIDSAGINFCIEVGSPSLRLIEQCKEIKADLVVMRAHQRDSVLEKIVGSTTDRVIRAACAPVLVVKRPVTRSYQRVVVATEKSGDSAASVPFVAALLPSAGLNLLHVVQIPLQFEAAMLRAGSDQAAIAVHRNALVDKAKVAIRDMAKSLPDRQTQSVTRVIVGDPAETLVQATWSRYVDLLVLGPGRTGKLRRALLGGVTQRLLRDAACDILIFRPVSQASYE